MSTTELNPTQSGDEVGRRSFLRATTCLAGIGVLKTSVLAKAFAAESPIASTKSGKVRGYIDRISRAERRLFAKVPYVQPGT